MCSEDRALATRAPRIIYMQVAPIYFCIVLIAVRVMAPCALIPGTIAACTSTNDACGHANRAGPYPPMCPRTRPPFGWGLGARPCALGAWEGRGVVGKRALRCVLGARRAW